MSGGYRLARLELLGAVELLDRRELDGTHVLAPQPTAAVAILHRGCSCKAAGITWAAAAASAAGSSRISACAVQTAKMGHHSAGEQQQLDVPELESWTTPAAVGTVERQYHSSSTAVKGGER